MYGIHTVLCTFPGCPSWSSAVAGAGMYAQSVCPCCDAESEGWQTINLWDLSAAQGVVETLENVIPSVSTHVLRTWTIIDLSRDLRRFGANKPTYTCRYIWITHTFTYLCCKKKDEGSMSLSTLDKGSLPLICRDVAWNAKPPLVESFKVDFLKPDRLISSPRYIDAVIC